MLENNPSGKPRNTRHYWKYLKYPDIPERKKDTWKYPIVFLDTATRTRPATRYFVQYPTRYWKTLPAGYCLPLPIDNLSNPTHRISISLVGLVLLICIWSFTITCMSKRNEPPKEQRNHLSPTHLSIEIGPTDLPTFSFNWTPRLKRNCIYQRFKDFGFSKCSTNKKQKHLSRYPPGKGTGMGLH